MKTYVPSKTTPNICRPLSKLSSYTVSLLALLLCVSPQISKAQTQFKNTRDNQKTPEVLRVKLQLDNKILRLNGPSASATTIATDKNATTLWLGLAIGDNYHDGMDNGKKGKWKLTYDETKIKIWRQGGTTWSTIASNTEYDQPVLPKQIHLRVEGIGISAAENDVEIKAQLQITTPAEETPLEATTKLTVAQVVLEKCPNTFLPQGGNQDNEVELKAKIIPADLKGKFKFELSGVSNEPGYALNAPLTIPSNGEDSSSWKDLQFPSQADVNVSGYNSDIATTTTETNEKTIKVKSFDYGAYGKISAQITFSSGSLLRAWEDGTTNTFTRIPLDSNENDIADGAAQNVSTDNTFAATDDNDNTPAGEGTNGDRLTRYEEYRGFMVAGAHTRTDVSKKDVFYCDADNVGHQNYWTATNLGAPIHKISTSEVDSNRFVTSNKSSHPGDGQKAIKQMMNIKVHLRQFPFGDSGIDIPFNVNHNAVHEDSQKWGIRGGTNLATNITATATTIIADLQEFDPGWAGSGTLKIGDELMTYTAGSSDVNNATLTFTGVTRGVGGTTAVAHNTGAFVPYFTDPDEVIRLVVAHECGHAVHINHDDSASLMAGSNPAGKVNANSNFRHTGTVKGSTQEFKVK